MNMAYVHGKFQMSLSWPYLYSPWLASVIVFCWRGFVVVLFSFNEVSIYLLISSKNNAKHHPSYKKYNGKQCSSDSTPWWQNWQIHSSIRFHAYFSLADVESTWYTLQQYEEDVHWYWSDEMCAKRGIYDGHTFTKRLSGVIHILAYPIKLHKFGSAIIFHFGHFQVGTIQAID